VAEVGKYGCQCRACFQLRLQP